MHVHYKDTGYLNPEWSLGWVKLIGLAIGGGSGPEWPQVENFSRKKNRNFSGLLKDSRKKLWSRINRNNQGTQPAKKKGGIHRILVRNRRFFPGFVAENSRDGHGWLDSIPKRQSWILPPKHKNWKVNGADRFLGLITTTWRRFLNGRRRRKFT